MQRMPTNVQYSSLKRMNRKGDIPITILVIGVIAVCILTIFSFMMSKSDIDETFVGAGLIETIYEPYLLQIGMIERTPRGRKTTKLAHQHLGIKLKNNSKRNFDGWEI